MPVCDLLGGRYGEDFHLYRAISQNTPEAMAENVAAYREEGYRRFQLKVGGDPDVDIQRIREVAGVLKPGDRLVADANTGWTQEGAMRVVHGVSELDVYIEQPCLSYQECLAIRRHCNHPFVLDEVVDGVDMLIQGKKDLAMDVVNIKISKFGGLTRARLARDLCVQMGVAMTIEDSWRRHHYLCHCTPGPQHAHGIFIQQHRFQQLRHSAHCPWGPTKGVRSTARVIGAWLGITPMMETLGEPVWTT